jgi:catechol 2,3-dioxygenase-like lactoylglutathione lyase family enzyme
MASTGGAAMTEPRITGMFNVKVPVRDVARSRAWYHEVLGFAVDMEFPDETGVVRGVTGHLAGVPDVFFSLRENPEGAAGMEGADLVGLAVADRAAIEAWAARLDELGIEHSPTIDATVGWLLVFHDPDGIEIHLYSQERHGIDQTGRPGYGQAVASAAG